VKPPESEAAAYIGAVLVLYVDLPDTPMRYGPTDLALAGKLFQEGVPLVLVESAFLLASLRRLIRPAGSPPLPKIRSLAYFIPVVAELQQQPLPSGYLDYLRLKLARVASRPDDQKNTFLHDR
jgi:hypothetical protein